MKKLLLSMAAVVLALTAGAQNTVCFNPDGNNYPGEDKVITFSGTNGNPESDSNALCGKSFTAPGAVTMAFAAGTNTQNFAGVGTWKHVRIYVGNTVTFTPAAGVTITKIEIKYTGTSYAKGFTSNVETLGEIDGTTQTWSGSSTSDVVLTASGTSRIYYFLVTYTGGQEAVAEPTFSVESSFVEAGSTVALSCATEGAQIHYTTDGTTPDATSAVYSAPIAINGHIIINAIGIKEGAVSSNVVTGNYGVLYAPEGAEVAEYNFADVTTLTPAQEKPEAQGDIAVADLTFTAGEVALTFDEGTASTPSRIYCSAQEVTTLRVYTGSSMTFTATDAVINNIEFVEADPFGLTYDAEDGYLIGTVWSAESEGVESVTFKAAGNATIGSIKVSVSKKADAIQSVAVEAAEGAVEYYNLQGVRVAEPAAGLYIRRQGNVATKVLVK